jgi:hypothetical protein
MANTTYQVTLSMDGNHRVSVASDDQAAVKTGLVWAKRVYDLLVARSISQPREAEKKNENAPICAVHNVPMTRQKGRHGSFWSCHRKDSGGSFCSYRPKER